MRVKDFIKESTDKYSVRCDNGQEFPCGNYDHAENKARSLLSYNKCNVAYIVKNGQDIFKWALGSKLEPISESVILEYNQVKTAQVFGNKLIAALATDKSSHLGTLGGSREYLRQKDKIGVEVDEQNKNYIVKAILQDLENADPTPNREYTQWLAKCYANEFQKIEDLTSKGTDWLKKYHQFKVKRILPDNLRNIANIKFSQLYDIVANEELNAKLDAIENAPSKDKGQSKVVYDDANVRIIVPQNEEAACYYGQGTRWCTAARQNNMFDRYNNDGPMYILLPKQPQYDGEKYQLHFASEQFMDEQDSEIDSNHLFQTRFPGTLDFFKENEPEISTWVLYASNEVLQPLIIQIQELMMDNINDILSEWEAEDGYYYQWLEENGYATEDGTEIDWERVAEDDIDYMTYNDEAKEWYDDILDALNPTPETCRELASSRDADYGSHLAITDLEKCIVVNIENEMDNSSAATSISEDVEKSIVVRHDANGYYVQKADYKGNFPKAREV